MIPLLLIGTLSASQIGPMPVDRGQAASCYSSQACHVTRTEPEPDNRYYRSRTTKGAKLPFSDAVRAGNLLYLNNQIGNRPGEGVLVAGGFREQFAQIIQNIDGSLKANGLARADVVMCTVTLTDMTDWSELNHLWAENFADNRLPARNVIGTTGLPLGAVVGVQCIAAYPAKKSSR